MQPYSTGVADMDDGAVADLEQHPDVDVADTVGVGDEPVAAAWKDTSFPAHAVERTLITSRATPWSVRYIPPF